MHSDRGSPDGWDTRRQGAAERVARVVFKAATVARPRTRYNVGFWARFGPIGRALTPDRVGVLLLYPTSDVVVTDTWVEYSPM